VPSTISCNFSPVAVTPGASSVTMTTLTITTVARSGDLFRIPGRLLLLLKGIISLLAAIWLFCQFYGTTRSISTTRRATLIVRIAAVVIVATAVSLVGCGEVTSGPAPTVTNNGTPNGTYTVSVIASSESLSHQVTLSLIVK
jgi:chromate transport protein ChrA